MFPFPAHKNEVGEQRVKFCLREKYSRWKERHLRLFARRMQIPHASWGSGRARNLRLGFLARSFFERLKIIRVRLPWKDWRIYFTFFMELQFSLPYATGNFNLTAPPENYGLWKRIYNLYFLWNGMFNLEAYIFASALWCWLGDLTNVVFTIMTGNFSYDKSYLEATIRERGTLLYVFINATSSWYVREHYNDEFLLIIICGNKERAYSHIEGIDQKFQSISLYLKVKLLNRS